MSYSLRDFCRIRTGVPEIKKQSEDGLLGIRIKNINHEKHRIDWSTVETVATSTSKYQILTEGDVLIIVRGAQHTAVVVSDIPQTTVATNQFFVISIKEEQRKLLHPEYLAWYLNFPARKVLATQATGKVIPVLSKEALLNMAFKHLSILTQLQIVEVLHSMREEERLFKQLQESRQLALVSLVSKE